MATKFCDNTAGITDEYILQQPLHEESTVQSYKQHQPNSVSQGPPSYSDAISSQPTTQIEASQPVPQSQPIEYHPQPYPPMREGADQSMMAICSCHLPCSCDYNHPLACRVNRTLMTAFAVTLVFVGGIAIPAYLYIH